MGILPSSKRIARGAVIVFLGMLLSRALSYIYTALVARLGSSEYGLLSLALVIVSFISIFAALGLRTGVARYVAYFKGKNNNKKIKGTIISSLKLSLPFTLVLTFLLFIFSEEISIFFFHNADLIPILKISSLALPFISFSDLFLAVIIGFQKIEYKVLIKEILETVIKLILTFIVIYFGYHLLGVTIVYVLSIIITAILSFYFLQKKIFPFFKTKVATTLITRELFIFSIPLIFSSVLTLVIKWTDVLMIGYFKTTSEVGIYNVALPTANLLVIVPTSLMAIFMPIITEFYSKRKFKEIKHISMINSKWIFFLNFPLFLLILFFSEDILSIMFGPEYVSGGTALLILIFGYMVRSLFHVPATILTMLKKTKLLFCIGLVSAISNVVLNILLIPRMGIVGGAIATSFSFIFSFVFVSRYAYRLTRVQPLKLSYLKSIFAGIISFVMIYYAVRLIGDISFVYLILFSIIFLIVYAFLVYLLRGLNKEDIEIVKIFFSKVKKLKMF